MPTMKTAIADDLQRFDNTETVVHCSVLDGMQRRASIAYALVRRISGGEVLAGGGVFDGTELVFHLLESEVQYAPKADDRILRFSGTLNEVAYRIIDAQPETWETRHRCIAKMERTDGGRR